MTKEKQIMQTEMQKDKKSNQQKNALDARKKTHKERNKYRQADRPNNK